MDGMRIVATADVVPGRSAAAYAESGLPSSQVIAMDDDVTKAGALIQEGHYIATTRADWLVRIPALDVILECTGVPEVGAQVCLAAIDAGKSVVNMNVETDATVGYRLAQRAVEQNVVYTLIGGDEPGAIKVLYDFADVLGFEIVAIGKGKNNPLDRTATPDTVRAEAAEARMSPKMLASFVDGTKTMVEMTAVGNATGYAPEVPGGYGPRCTVDDLPKVFVPRSAGGIFNAPGAVDFAIGPAPGVFVVITTDQPKVIRDLNYLHLRGHGGFWVLYRPYHLANIEAPITIARAVLDREVTLATFRPPVCETVACAKRDLRPGDTIDGLGGFTVYGLIERARAAADEHMVPLGLIVGATVERPVKAGEPIRFADVALDERQSIVGLRREQDNAVLTIS